MKIQLCIVFHQLPANLIPVLHDRPDRIVLVATPTMLEKGDQLESLLRSLGGYSPDNITRFDDLPESPHSAIEDRELEIQDELTSPFPEAYWVLNATGGNKAMSLAGLASRNILVCQLDQLARLADQIKQWMDTGIIVKHRL